MACGLFNSKSYYCANYGQGTLVLTIGDNGIHEIDNNKVEKVLTVFPQLISSLDLNHRSTFKNYLIDRNFKLIDSENTIKGLLNEQLIVAELDSTNRLTSLKKSHNRMIPQINKYDFYLYSDFRDGDNPFNLIQLYFMGDS